MATRPTFQASVTPTSAPGIDQDTGLAAQFERISGLLEPAKDIINRKLDERAFLDAKEEGEIEGRSQIPQLGKSATQATQIYNRAVRETTKNRLTAEASIFLETQEREFESDAQGFLAATSSFPPIQDIEEEFPQMAANLSHFMELRRQRAVGPIQRRDAAKVEKDRAQSAKSHRDLLRNRLRTNPEESIELDEEFSNSLASELGMPDSEKVLQMQMFRELGAITTFSKFIAQSDDLEAIEQFSQDVIQDDETYSVIGQQSREALRNEALSRVRQITQSRRVDDSLARARANQERKDALESAEVNGEFVPLSEFTQSQMDEGEQFEHGLRMNQGVDGHRFKQAQKGLSIPDQEAMAARVRDNVADPRITSKHVSDLEKNAQLNREALAADPAQYALDHNESLAALEDQVPADEFFEALVEEQRRVNGGEPGFRPSIYPGSRADADLGLFISEEIEIAEKLSHLGDMKTRYGDRFGDVIDGLESKMPEDMRGQGLLTALGQTSLADPTSQTLIPIALQSFDDLLRTAELTDSKVTRATVDGEINQVSGSLLRAIKDGDRRTDNINLLGKIALDRMGRFGESESQAVKEAHRILFRDSAEVDGSIHRLEDVQTDDDRVALSKKSAGALAGLIGDSQVVNFSVANQDLAVFGYENDGAFEGVPGKPGVFFLVDAPTGTKATVMTPGGIQRLTITRDELSAISEFKRARIQMILTAGIEEQEIQSLLEAKTVEVSSTGEITLVNRER